jgi:methanethiol S-methyltransferase
MRIKEFLIFVINSSNNMLPYILQIFFWFAYGALHSILASSKVKRFLSKTMGNGYRLYRLIYNLIAFVLLVALLWYQHTLPANRFWGFDGLVDILSGILELGGLIIIFMALRGYDLREFSGLKSSAKSSVNEFRSGGLLRYVRHPLYTGTILLVWGMFLEEASMRILIMTVCVTAYIFIGIVYEERKLVAEFGEKYLEYRRRVPMLFPNFYSGR